MWKLIWITILGEVGKVVCIPCERLGNINLFYNGLEALYFPNILEINIDHWINIDHCRDLRKLPNKLCKFSGRLISSFDWRESKDAGMSVGYTCSFYFSFYFSLREVISYLRVGNITRMNTRPSSSSETANHLSACPLITQLSICMPANHLSVCPQLTRARPTSLYLFYLKI